MDKNFCEPLVLGELFVQFAQGNCPTVSLGYKAVLLDERILDEPSILQDALVKILHRIHSPNKVMQLCVCAKFALFAELI